MPRRELTPTSAALLGLLADCGATTGADLVREAELRIGGYWKLTRSQVYRELTGLAAAGYVVGGPRGPRDAQPFDLTPAGREAFADWLAGSVPGESVRIGMLLLVAFGRHLPEGRLREILDDYGRRHRERLAFYEELDADLEARGADPFVRATLSFGLHHERAVLAWLDALPPQVRGGVPAAGGEG
jgi:DNA-binding PadR family transcriptional regulator